MMLLTIVIYQVGNIFLGYIRELVADVTGERFNKLSENGVVVVDVNADVSLSSAAFLVASKKTRIRSLAED